MAWLKPCPAKIRGNDDGNGNGNGNGNGEERSFAALRLTRLEKQVALKANSKARRESTACAAGYSTLRWRGGAWQTLRKLLVGSV
jgi:hypothetical protein